MLRKKTTLILVLVGLLGIAAIGFAAWKINGSLNDMNVNTESALKVGENEGQDNGKSTMSNAGAAIPNKGDEVSEEDEDFYALLIGLDYRPGSYTMNTDTIIAAHVIPQTGKIKLISLPRDLRIELDNGEARKINALFYDGYAYARQKTNANPELLSGRKVTLGGLTVPEEYFTSGMVHLREQVEDFLDIKIKYSFLIHFETLVQLVDAVGGIEIEVKRSMQYDDPTDGTHIYFEPGLQKMDGQQALNYARFRQDNRGPKYYSNDFERGERQQEVIAALADKLSSWRSLGRVFDILDVVSNSFKTDMSKTQIMSFLTMHYKDFDGQSIETIVIEGAWDGKYVIVDEQDLGEFRRRFVSTDDDPLAPPRHEVSLAMPYQP
jgi:LCP family protein required for cell wall assembly